MNKYLLLLTFIIGVFFRLWFIGLMPQYFGFDQKEYHEVALDILGDRSNMYTSTYRLYGYPLLLATLYKFFGIENIFSWKLIQAILDTSSALLVFLIARNIFKSKKAAWISYLLCLFNPFSSSYVGVRMTEVMTIFFVTLIFFLFLLTLKIKKLFPLLLLALILGFTPQIRPGFFYFTLFVLAILLFRVVRSVVYYRRKLISIGLILLLYCLPFTYNVVKNLIYFQQFSILTVDNLFVREFYISLFIGNADTISAYPDEVHLIYQEFSTAPDKEARDKINTKYLGLARREIKKDPGKFIISRVKKMWYVWEKHNLFPYTNPKNLAVNFLVYFGNIIILAFAFLGYILWVRKGTFKWFALLFLFFMIYISVLHAFTITAERFSLPVYPLVFLFGGYSLWAILEGIINVKDY